MQYGKNVKGSVKEKVEKMTAHDPVEKDMAARKGEERMVGAKLNKREAMTHNTVARHKASVGGPTGYTASGTGTHTYSTSGATAQPTGAHQMSALPGHGTEQPAGQVTEGVVESHPIGINTSTGRTAAHNTGVGRNPPGYGTGGTFS